MFGPTPGEYEEAIQDPNYCFVDSDLKQSQPELNQLYTPRPYSGFYASVYKLKSANRQWAVKCFTRQVPDQQQRYEAISKHLASTTIPYTVSFSYLNEGIKVNNKFYPIVKMEWIQGEQLDSYVKRNVNNPHELIALSNKWLRMLDELRNVGIAHGDFQHGNILIVDNEIKLIDYDGMYVPSLAGWQSNEIGHRNYQHPGREGSHFNSEIDNFSSWVIYLTFLSLSVAPRILQEVKTDEEFIIFKQEDFLYPDSSKLFTLLKNIHDPYINNLLTHFTTFKDLNVTAIPRLQDLLYQSPRLENRSVPSWLQDHLPTAGTSNKHATYTGENIPDLDIIPVLNRLAKIKESGDVALSNFRKLGELFDNMGNAKPVDLPLIFSAGWEQAVVHLPQRRSDYKASALQYYDQSFQIIANINIEITKQRTMLGGYCSSSLVIIYFSQPMVLLLFVLFSIIVLFYLKRAFNCIPLNEYASSLIDSYDSYQQAINEKEKWVELHLSRLKAYDEQLYQVYEKFLANLKEGKRQLALIKASANELRQLNANIEGYPEVCCIELNSTYSSFVNLTNQLKSQYLNSVDEEKNQAKQLSSSYDQNNLALRAAISRLRHEEARILKQIEDRFNEEKIKLNNEINKLNHQQEADKEELLQVKMQQYLARHTIASAQITGIGEVLKDRLSWQGITTAVDIIDIKQDWDNNIVIGTPHGIKRVEGIGLNKGYALVNWRKNLEASANISLTPWEKTNIIAKYQQQYEELLNSLSRSTDDLNKKKEEISIKFNQKVEQHNQSINKSQENYFNDLKANKGNYRNLREQIKWELDSIADKFRSAKDNFYQEALLKLKQQGELKEQFCKDLLKNYQDTCLIYGNNLKLTQSEFEKLKQQIDKQYSSIEKDIEEMYCQIRKDQFVLSKVGEKMEFVKSISFLDYLKHIFSLPNKLKQL